MRIININNKTFVYNDQTASFPHHNPHNTYTQRVAAKIDTTYAQKQTYHVHIIIFVEPSSAPPLLVYLHMLFFDRLENVCLLYIIIYHKTF